MLLLDLSNQIYFYLWLLLFFLLTYLSKFSSWDFFNRENLFVLGVEWLLIEADQMISVRKRSSSLQLWIISLLSLVKHFLHLLIHTHMRTVALALTKIINTSKIRKISLLLALFKRIYFINFWLWTLWRWRLSWEFHVSVFWLKELLSVRSALSWASCLHKLLHFSPVLFE